MEGRRPRRPQVTDNSNYRVYLSAVTRRRFRPLPGPLRIRESGTLPHWDLEEGLYFVTFRLADSLPASLLRKYARTPTLDEAQRREIELALDRGFGKCYLRDPRVAEIVSDALHFLDGKAFRLDAWRIMPNHVHRVFQLREGRELWKVMHSLKTYTARQANKVLQRRGASGNPNTSTDSFVKERSTGSWITSSATLKRQG